MLSWVGSKKREESTREEIERSLAGTVGREGRDWFLINPRRHGPRSYKAQWCLDHDVGVIVDDSAEVIFACRAAGIYAIPINGAEAHPDGFSNLSQALTVERILAPRRVPDR